MSTPRFTAAEIKAWADGLCDCGSITCSTNLDMMRQFTEDAERIETLETAIREADQRVEELAAALPKNTNGQCKATFDRDEYKFCCTLRAGHQGPHQHYGEFNLRFIQWPREHAATQLQPRGVVSTDPATGPPPCGPSGGDSGVTFIQDREEVRALLQPVTREGEPPALDATPRAESEAEK